MIVLVDLRVAPGNPLPWTEVVTFLAIVLVLAVGFVATLAVLLIRYKRRQVLLETEMNTVVRGGGAPEMAVQGNLAGSTQQAEPFPVIEDLSNSK